jgi:hypothetical protein
MKSAVELAGIEKTMPHRVGIGVHQILQGVLLTPEMPLRLHLHGH